MKALLLILAVNSINADDIPGRVSLEFPSMQQCIDAKETINYNLKFKQFIIESKCIELQSSPTISEIK